MSQEEAFWQVRSLAEMSPEELESVCDGCGWCCVHRLQDEDTQEIWTTDVVCRYLDLETIQCTCYHDRPAHVPECLVVTPEVAQAEWLPETCAYRLLARGQDLPEWHHLITNDRNSVHDAGASVKGRVISEESVHPDSLAERIVNNN